MSISAPFIRRPIATSLLMAAIFLVGLVTFPRLSIAPLPQVDFPTIAVWTNLPGGSPETMAALVATPLETQFAQIPGLTQLTSTSALGSAQVTLQFDLDRNIDAAAQDVQSAINAAAGYLPKNLPQPPYYRKVSPADAAILFLSVQSAALPLTTVDDYAENVIMPRLSQVAGVGLVAIGGQQKPAVRVQLDPAKVAALGLQLEDVANVIPLATVAAPKGAINGVTRNFVIYDNDQLLKAAPWNDAIVAYKSGAPVRIRDIGRAVEGPENSQTLAWQRAGPTIMLQVFKQPGANVIDVVARIQAVLPVVQAALPASIRVETVVDRTTAIKAAVRDVEFSLLLSVALVVLVIFLFLRKAWATVIPSVAIPLALLGSFALMYVLNYTLDNLSLMGLTIAVGFVVDDAIVMLENIYRHIEAGLSPREAAYQGAAEVGFTIVSISVSLVAVFIPLLLMGGIVGRMFHEFAITVAMAILVSAVVSLTLTPMMCARFLKSARPATHGRLYRASARGFSAMLAAYTRALDFVLSHRRATLATFCLTLALTVGLYIVVPKGLFPQQDIGFIAGLADASQDISFAEIVRLQHRLTDIIAQDPDVAGWATAVGGSQSMNNGFVVIGLKPRDQRGAAADQIVRRLRAKFAAVSGATFYLQAVQDLTIGARLSRTQYQYTLLDPDLDELDEWAPKLLAGMQALPGLRDVVSDQQNGSATLALRIDRDQAARFGIQPALIDQTLYDAFGQRQVAQYFTQLSTYHVVLEITPQLQSDPNTLNRIYIKSPLTGQQVPLSAFAKFDTQHVGFLTINHQGQFPAVTLSFNLAPGVALGDAVVAVEKLVNDIRMPRALVGTFQGTAQAFQSSLRSQPYLIAAALIAVYIILGTLYESYIHPLTILSTLPSAGVGALLMLLAFHFELTIIAFIGIILLIGIVKKNGIMMIDFAIQAQREHHVAPEVAIRQACLLRFRPIMMTTMAALLAALPLMLGQGTGAELRQPLGYAMVGGLLLSQALTLFTTPVIYLYLDRFSEYLQRGAAAGTALEAAVPGHPPAPAA